MINGGVIGNRKIKVGDWLICTARKISDDQPIVIYKIDGIEEECWTPHEENDEIADKTNSPVPLNTYIRILRGEIIRKLNGEVEIDTRVETKKPIKILISESGCKFNPMIGDHVEVEALFGVNRENPSEFNVFGYYGMKANEFETITGEITVYKKKMKYGLINDKYGNEKYLFYIDILKHSDNQKQHCMPNKGDTVTADVISSYQKIDDREFFYRCIRITKLPSKQGKNVNDTSSKIESVEFDDEIDVDGIVFTRNEALKATMDMKEKKCIELIATNQSNSDRKVSKVTFENTILESFIDCQPLYRPYVIKPGDCLVYKMNAEAPFGGEHKIKFSFKIDDKYTVRRCITLDVKNVDDIEDVRTVHSKAYTKQVYSEKRDIVKGYAPVVTPHFIDCR